MKRVAIVQSNYIPWKGYFDLIAAVDEFIIFDDVQFTRRDWRNRNKVKTPQGVQWLTVPVKVKGKYHQTIRETEIDGTGWAENHWRSLEQWYKKAPFFAQVGAWLAPLYLEETYLQLSALNRRFLEAICGYLAITTRLVDCSTYGMSEGRSERLAVLCAAAGATEYVSGPAALSYLEPTPFSQRDIAVTWFDYQGYEPYPQLWGEFVHQVSMVDLLFNCGPQSCEYLRHANPKLTKAKKKGAE